ncbi:excisionase [Symbiopectobacterium purcellii]|uniref:Excisionase n=1 Tax=Symbiopectobacterium purcellii TaxID=2871826 RepID=A0ABX9AML1_9ENTR|nr:excisionase [Symbiopectobacterium purcellii]QZN96422.1 excisionase [Symbiopectobacterium purcellii]QZN96460.1 excisionase [Symbiopectobacterium purcellii]
MAYITLSEWNRRQTRPRCMETVRRLVRSGMIFPAPIRDGREYLVEENACKLTQNKNIGPSSALHPTLLSRIRHGTPEKP